MTTKIRENTVKVFINVSTFNLSSFKGYVEFELNDLYVVGSTIVSDEPIKRYSIENARSVSILPNSVIGEGSYYSFRLIEEKGTELLSRTIVVPDHDCNITDIIVVDPPITPEPEQMEIWVAQVRNDMIVAEKSAVSAKTDADRAEQALTDIDIDTDFINQAVEQASSASVKAVAAQGKAEIASASATASATEATNAKNEVVTLSTSTIAAIKAEGDTQSSRLEVLSDKTEANAGIATTKAGEASASATSAKASEENAQTIKEDIIVLQDSTVDAIETVGATQLGIVQTAGKVAQDAAYTATTKAKEASVSASNALASATKAEQEADKASGVTLTRW